MAPRTRFATRRSCPIPTIDADAVMWRSRSSNEDRAMKVKESKGSDIDGSEDGRIPKVVILPLRRPAPELPKQDEGGGFPDYTQPAAQQETGRTSRRESVWQYE